MQLQPSPAFDLDTKEINAQVNTSPPIIDSINPLSSFSEIDKEPNSTEMETFEVELVKDQQGLGITIAGYVCEKGMSLTYYVSNGAVVIF